MSKLYTITTPKKIIGMADIMGPLTTPSEIEFNNVLEMVRLGYDIYQVNPYDHNEKIKVTLSNINNIKFKSSISMAFSQRKLNREIQEIDKPIIVDVKKKDNKQKETVEINKKTKDEHIDKTVEAQTIVKPDNFSK